MEVLRGFLPRAFISVAVEYRRQHSRWLTRAVRQPDRYPRIPTKPDALGGYSRMRSHQERRARADLWWSIALDRVDD